MTFVRHIFFVIIIALLMPLFALASQDTDVTSLQEKIVQKRDEVKEIEKSIESYKEKIRQKQVEAVSLKNQVSILDNRLAQVELDIDLTQARIETLDLEVLQLERSIEDKTEVIDRQKEVLGELLRNIHYADSKKYVEIAFAYDSFSDFYNSIQALTALEKTIGSSVTSLRLARADLEDRSTQAQDRRNAVEELREELTDVQQNYEEQTGLKVALLQQTQSSEKQFQTLVSSLKDQYRQIEGEISGIERDIRARLEANNRLDQIRDSGTDVLSWPTASRYVTARFHDPTYPYRHIFEHNAIDLRAGQGTPVKAAASGYVGRARRCSAATCYSYVMVVHQNGISTVYGHLSAISVSADDFVTRGDVIGLSGGTPGTRGAGPFVTGPHLHFEVRKNGIPQNPLNYLVKDY
jgi:murein DD-endopeptidase MepM/ murein hydrolase activator NlpD